MNLFSIVKANMFLSQENIMLKEKGSIFSPGGLRRDWTPEHLKFVEQLEKDGYKLRYSGGFVPDINQILIKKGGVFTYPALKKSPQGKLRLLFELQPMAFYYGTSRRPGDRRQSRYFVYKSRKC